MGSAIDAYAACIDAVIAQRERLHGQAWPGARWEGAGARRFSMDPRRTLSPNLRAVAAYVRPDDVVLDVGGGAGRVCLPLALRCREAINLDPSAGMQAEFAARAAEAGITNARAVAGAWETLATRPDLCGEVVIVANLTYFVREIGHFLRALEAAARRRVLITLWSVAPSHQDAAIFARIYGEPQQPVPSYRELLPALWELGILPDVRVLPEGSRDGPPPQTRAEAISWLLDRLHEGEGSEAHARIDAAFADLFTASDAGFVPRWRPPVHELLITWQPARGS